MNTAQAIVSDTKQPAPHGLFQVFLRTGGGFAVKACAFQLRAPERAGYSSDEMTIAFYSSYYGAGDQRNVVIPDLYCRADMVAAIVRAEHLVAQALAPATVADVKRLQERLVPQPE